ncbi:hypothetical protein HMPREF1544_07956 [Mucor circinelloides 1006PhL]|uniref:Uncharacterized protein n=1 Tax=Mucor circinelloides f. circinelloides (strain 1006PhL) TaxID=1220926 RepID=S2JZK0_MUCC1|nr:hypothetical protein HMPREF1544_07956 [Mucor circinelloides 1006PhL]
MKISRDRAICMLFHVEFNQENVNRCKQDISNLSSKFQVCYQADPKQPILVPETRIFGDPTRYRVYPEVVSTETGEDVVEEECKSCKERIQEASSNLSSANGNKTPKQSQKRSPANQDTRFIIAQIPRRKQFYHPSVYNSYNEILNSLKKYTAIFDFATVFMFLEWCDVYQTPIAISNLFVEGETCCILKEEYWDEAAKNIAAKYLK